MKENDYYGHYKAFVKELAQNPEQTLQLYCNKNGVVWRRLYDWMRRHHISLKRIYQAYRRDTAAAGPDRIGGAVEFMELMPMQVSGAEQERQSEDIMAGDIRIDLPAGISLSVGGCSVPALTRLIVGLRKEVSDVLS